MIPCVPARRNGAETGRLAAVSSTAALAQEAGGIIFRRRDVEHDLDRGGTVQPGVRRQPPARLGSSAVRPCKPHTVSCGTGTGSRIRGAMKVSASL